MDIPKKAQVKYGTIYTYDGIGIGNLAVIFSTDLGVMKIGDNSDGSLFEYYKTQSEKYKQAGFNGNIEFLSFDRYNGTLSIEEICTLYNYIKMGISYEAIINLINMDLDNLKNMIQDLNKIGY